MRDVHDHARVKVQARLDGIEQDIFRVGAVSAVALEAEPLDYRHFGFQRGEGGVGAAALRHVIHDERQKHGRTDITDSVVAFHGTSLTLRLARVYGAITFLRLNRWNGEETETKRNRSARSICPSRSAAAACWSNSIVDSDRPVKRQPVHR